MPDLPELADAFAVELSDRVARIIPNSPEFLALVRPPDGDGQGRVSISSTDRTTLKQIPIQLQTANGDRLRLLIRYECCWDTGQDFLAVEESYFHVLAGRTDDPLFRVEYDRNMTSAPAAHIQIHAHRDELVFLMSRAGRSAGRGKGDRIPRLSDLHFPVGGHRFRPCLEDVLEVLVYELGVETLDGWRQTIDDGRESWRRLQLRAAVRDAPAEAAQVLRALGYTVDFNGDPAPPDNAKRLRAI